MSSKKLLILVEMKDDRDIHDTALPDYLQTTLSSSLEWDGANYIRVDVEGVDGVTRESILADLKEKKK